MREDQFERLYGLLQQEPKIHTKDRARERRFLAAVYWLGRSGAQWRCLPAAYGRWNGVRSMRLLGSAGAPTRSQQSNTDQQMSFRNRWSSRTSSRIASGSWSRCHRHSRRPALSPSPSGAAARAALIA